MLKQLYYKIVEWPYWGGFACYGLLIIGFVILTGIILAIILI